jgi:hypothetical protein
MITHVVLLKIRSEVPQKQIDSIFAALAGLKSKIPGLLSFSGGPYSSPEGLHKGFTHGFVMTFTDAKARDIYLPHPDHEVVKAMVLPVLQGGLDGVVAFDYAS